MADRPSPQCSSSRSWPVSSMSSAGLTVWRWESCRVTFRHRSETSRTLRLGDYMLGSPKVGTHCFSNLSSRFNLISIWSCCQTFMFVQNFLPQSFLQNTHSGNSGLCGHQRFNVFCGHIFFCFSLDTHCNDNPLCGRAHFRMSCPHVGTSDN